MIVLLVLTLLLMTAGLIMQAVMLLRGEPLHGLWGLILLIAAGMVGAAYGGIQSGTG